MIYVWQRQRVNSRPLYQSPTIWDMSSEKNQIVISWQNAGVIAFFFTIAIAKKDALSCAKDNYFLLFSALVSHKSVFCLYMWSRSESIIYVAQGMIVCVGGGINGDCMPLPTHAR